MAGRGTRLRPHTLTVPKPLIPIAGKPIVQRIVEDLSRSYPGEIQEVAFVIGDFGPEVEYDLLKVAESIGAKGKIFYQKEALGTAHAIYCAAQSLTGNCMIAFADTLFKADFTFNTEDDGYIWVMKVDEPSAYGVIKLDEAGIIKEFVEKPADFISDQAVVGIYYFKDGDGLREEIKGILDGNIKDKGEFQLTTALENLKNKGVKFRPAEIEEWLDCGNKSALIYANQRILHLNKDQHNDHAHVNLVHSSIISPCYIGKNVQLQNSVIGPYVSIGDNCIVEDSIIRNSIIQNDSKLRYACLEDSMIGSKASYEGNPSIISIGDYSTLNS